jgi:hypothetical protein
MPMRTESGALPPAVMIGTSRRLRWISAAQTTASSACAKAAMKESPFVFTSNPRCAPRSPRIRSLWGSRICSRYRRSPPFSPCAATRASRNAVEPTMSVNINVTVPVGGSIAFAPGLGVTHSRTFLPIA